MLPATRALRPAGAIVCCVLLSALVLAGAWGSPARAAKLKIAIVAFDTVNDLAEEEGWGRQVSEMLTTAAVNTGAFEVVERHLLEKIMSEQAMGNRDQGFTSVAQSVGNMVGADFLLSGSVFKSPKGQLRVDARLVDVANGEIIVAKSFLTSDDLGPLSGAAKKTHETDRGQRIFRRASQRRQARRSGCPGLVGHLQFFLSQRPQFRHGRWRRTHCQ